jgi:hypothetical protein
MIISVRWLFEAARQKAKAEIFCKRRRIDDAVGWSGGEQSRQKNSNEANPQKIKGSSASNT